ncbi:MAG TPA: RNA polymerase sigma factor RpoD/SigA [Spirochaetota bacterium]|nr:RNA polymerase sigma factor RpoD/SigA [Spirochaetota bacterium]HNT11508.1 RNA polymerase sigma factor RpoD/SigA [Spirochaetota bacterium]
MTERMHDSSMPAKSYYKNINEFQLLTQEEEIELARAKTKGDDTARERLVNANLRLVIKIARNYTMLEPSLVDLIQEGNIGLMRAAEKFDHRMGCRFSTYASYWIKHYISRFIAKKSRTIRLPIRKGDLFKKVKRVRDELLREFGKEPTRLDIANVLGVEEKTVAEIMEFFQPTMSLEGPLNNDDFSLMQVLGDEKTLSPETMLYRQDLHDELEEALESLMENERKILRMRFGFDDDRVITLKEIGSEFGISAETVRQIENRAIEKIRQKFSHLQDYMD